MNDGLGVMLGVIRIIFNAKTRWERGKFDGTAGRSKKTKKPPSTKFSKTKFWDGQAFVRNHETLSVVFIENSIP